MSNNELKEYQVGTTAMQMADMSKINQGTVAIESSRAMVEAQGKLLLAKQFPRNYTQSYTKAIEACQRKGFAESAFYSCLLYTSPSPRD